MLHEKLEDTQGSLDDPKTEHHNPFQRRIPHEPRRARRLLRDFSELLMRLIVVLGGFLLVGHSRSGVFISGESFRFRPAVSRAIISFLVFILGGSFSLFSLLGDGWLTRETLTRSIN